AGAVVGGALASGAYGYYGPGYYDDSYGYYDDSAPVAVEVAPGGGDATYCAQRYKSYDVRSGTYLGYDGLRHPCP
ncbi:BA14K family protein, partial [Bradyrhizobium elkanii]|uniref:BA14K family protein n=3 Tax=Bradyrhizobium TaxID=374 RepID=UPI0005C258ED